MQHLKSTMSIFIAVLLTACHPLPESKKTVGLADNKSTPLGITERAAFELLIVALEQRPNADLDCLQFLPESKNDNAIATTWEFAAVEVHDDICGGDPYVGHVRNRYKVNASGSVMVYDAITAEYEQL